MHQKRCAFRTSKPSEECRPLFGVRSSGPILFDFLEKRKKLLRLELQSFKMPHLELQLRVCYCIAAIVNATSGILSERCCIYNCNVAFRFSINQI